MCVCVCVCVLVCIYACTCVCLCVMTDTLNSSLFSPCKLRLQNTLRVKTYKLSVLA